MRSALLLVLLTASAHAGNNELTLTESTRALRTSSANAITEDSMYGGAFAYGRKLGIELGLPVELWAQGSFAWGVATGTMFQTMSTDLSTLAFTIGGQARYELHHRITASARLDLGTTRASLEIRDDMAHSASDHGWGAMTAAAVGVDFYAFRGSQRSLSLRFEVGAVATSSIPLTATPDAASDDTLELEMSAASLGALNLSGPSFAASVVGQF